MIGLYISHHWLFNDKSLEAVAEFIGHEGRHRMQKLMELGFDKVPVILVNESNKYDKVSKSLLLTSSMLLHRFMSFQKISRILPESSLSRRSKIPT